MKKIISVLLSSIITAAAALSFMPKDTVNAAEEYDPNKWTILCYFCGSDLEQDECASTDVKEMIDATEGTDLRFVVMCGGSDVDHDYFKSYASFRLLIEDGRVYKVGDPTLRNMGDEQTLTDFLRWGSLTFPSEKTGVVIWDHGGGALGGCCYDDLFDYDNLTLPEMNASFEKAMDIRGEKFDFVAYDCCLMASLELACMLEDSADYLVASQEVMPGEGFDYTAIADYITAHPDCDSYSACEAICNGYWDSFGGDVPYYATISIMDLNKIDTMMTTLGRYCDSVDQYMNASEARSLCNALNQECDIDYNFVDMYSFIDCCSSYVDPASFALNEAISDFVPYARNGSAHQGCSGVTLYIPVTSLYEDEEELFSKILPEYTGYTNFIHDLTGY